MWVAAHCACRKPGNHKGPGLVTNYATHSITNTYKIFCLEATDKTYMNVQ